MEIKDCSSLTLAYLGDAVYEQFVRERVIQKGLSPKVDVLHKQGVKYVKAPSQAKAIKEMINSKFLSEEEVAVAKRARNHRTATKAKHADPIDYKWATALEALIGWLKLEKQEERLQEVMEKAVEIIDEAAL